VRIAVDASRAARPNPTGTERYARDLLEALVPAARGHELILYYDREPPQRLPGATTRVVSLPRLWTHVRLSLEMLRSRPDVLFVPAHVVPLVHPATVVTIHDLGYLRYRLAYTPAAWTYLFLSTRWSARVARRIVVDSWATRGDLLRHCRVDPARVDVVHLGVEPRFRPQPSDAVRQLGLEPDDYLLFVGTLQPRKNLPRLLRAYARALREAGGVRPGAEHRAGAGVPPLAIAGAAGHRADELGRLIASLGIRDHVRALGYVDDALSPALFAGARAFLFPSLFEGFGLPLLEAMASGTPVLGGNNSSMPEIVGDAGILVNAHDETAIARAILRLSTDTALRQRLRGKGLERAAQFTWERTAHLTLEALERAAAPRGRR
jgi:glycosyltransferase involved in cell wall biosynthesis